MQAHYKRTNEWPDKNSGTIPELPGETWASIDSALYRGKRGLYKSSLAKLREQLGGKRNHYNLPNLTKEIIKKWVQLHFSNTGKWPTEYSGLVDEAPYKITWRAVNAALRQGLRGFRGGSSLAKFLFEEFGKRNTRDLPNLDIEEIKKCISAHKKRTGKLPNRHAGPIPELQDETWGCVISALCRGSRGLPKGWSIANLSSD